ncbi:MAG: hypothetical protein HY427_02115 [Candidatus Levybacteria bacterium]|nr:hypothetical protein [Candidatus Levybacteria bacterium]
MQLTKDDFDKIRQIVRQEIGNETQAVKEQLLGKIAFSNLHLREGIGELKDRIKNFEIRLSREKDEEDNML